MKKILVILLTLSMLLSCASTNIVDAEVSSVDGLERARDYISALYSTGKDSRTVAANIKVVEAAMIKGVSYPITWSSDSELVTFKSEEAGRVTVVVDTKTPIEVKFNLIATIYDEEGSSTQISFPCVIPQDPTVNSAIKLNETNGNYDVNKEYILSVHQVNANKVLYLTGDLSGKYLATSENVEDAERFHIEPFNDGFAIYFEKESAKSYVEVLSVDGKATIQITQGPSNPWLYDSERNVLYTIVDDTPYYLGCYKTYTTVSASKTSYISNLDVIGVSQFPLFVYEPQVAAVRTLPVCEPVENKEYDYALYQASIDTTIYFLGTIDGNYIQTTANKAEGKRVSVEKAEGGWRIYFLDDNNEKVYVEIQMVDKARARLSKEPTCVWVFDSETGVPSTTLSDGASYYLGCYKTYTTVSASDVKYIADVSKIGVSQFPIRLLEEQFL